MDKLTFLLYCADLGGIALSGALYLFGATIAARFVFIVTMIGSAGFRFHAHDDFAYVHIVFGALAVPSFVKLAWAAHQREKQIRKAQAAA